jgi:hypothetical protein
VSEVSRDEFAMLRENVAKNARRLEEMDREGTRGVAVLAVQVADLAKDFGEHRHEHEVELKSRASSRRWAVGLAAVLFAAVESPLVTLLLSRH